MITNAIHPDERLRVEIALERSACKGFRGISLKNRVWVNGHKGFWQFCLKFTHEKSPAQFAFGFPCTEARPHWLREGVCLNV